MATGIAVEIFDRRRIWIVHHLAMVATGIAVEIFDRRRIWIVHHLAIDGYGDCGGGTGKAITTNLRGPHGSLCRE